MERTNGCGFRWSARWIRSTTSTTALTSCRSLLSPRYLCLLSRSYPASVSFATSLHLCVFAKCAKPLPFPCCCSLASCRKTCALHLNNHAHATPLQIQIHCRSKRQRPKSKVVDSLELQGHVAGGEADKSRGHIAAGAGAGAAYCWSCGEPPTDHRHRGWLRRSELELQRQVDDKHSPLRKGKWTKVETLSTL